MKLLDVKVTKKRNNCFHRFLTIFYDNTIFLSVSSSSESTLICTVTKLQTNSILFWTMRMLQSCAVFTCCHKKFYRIGGDVTTTVFIFAGSNNNTADDEPFPLGNTCRARLWQKRRLSETRK